MTPNHPPQLTGDHELGIFPDYAEDAYRAAPGVCQSDLKEMEVSPAHFYHKLTSPPKPPTPDQRIGQLLHALILCDREDFVTTPAGAPKYPSKTQWAAKEPSKETIKTVEWWTAFEKLHPGKDALNAEDSDPLYAMRQAVRDHPVAASILSRPGNNEVACWRRHGPTGLLLRGRADRLTTDDQNYTVVPDLKTVQRGAGGPDDFARSIFDWGYHRQSAHYCDLFEASYFVFIVVEKEPPYAVACYNLSPKSVEIGRHRNEEDLARVKECLDSGHWPAYPPGIKTIDLPAWVMRKEL